MFNYIVLKEKISERKCLRRLRKHKLLFIFGLFEKNRRERKDRKKLKQYISENCSGCGNYIEI